MSRELLARAWATGAGPGDGPLTIDLDSTVCETFGLCKEGAQRHNYAGQRGYHPILAVAAGTGDVLMARLREGRANTARGAAHFLRETVGRVRYAGATGQLTVRADSGFYAHALVAVCRKMDVRFSITARQHPRLRNIIEAIPEGNWTPISYWMEGAADEAETTYVPFESEPNAAPVRLIVRRVKPTPGSQLALFANYSYHAFITDRDGATLELEADHRRHAEIENAIRDLKYGVGLNHLPSGRFPANPEPAEGGLAGRPGHGPQSGSLDNARRPGRATGNHQDPQAALLLPGRTAHPLGAPPHFASSPALALGNPVQQRSGETARPPTPFLTAPDRPPDYPQAWLSRARLGPVCLLLPSAQLISPSATPFGRQQPLSAALTLRTQPNLYGSRLCSLFPEPLIPALASATASLRRIRAKSERGESTDGGGYPWSVGAESHRGRRTEWLWLVFPASAGSVRL